MATPRHRSLVLQGITEGSYNVRYKAEGYHDDEFTITVAQTEAATFSYDLEPIAQGEVWLQSPETVIPSEIYLEEPADFQFYISNTGEIDTGYAIRIEFESVGLPEQLTFVSPIADHNLIWSRRIPAGAYTINHAIATLPSEAIPADREVAAYDVYVTLLAR